MLCDYYYHQLEHKLVTCDISVMNFFTLTGLLACVYCFVYAILLWYKDCNLELALCEIFGKKLGKLQGKVVWITRATTELGKLLALKVAENNGKLILTSSVIPELEKVRELCLRKNPKVTKRDILLIPFDIKDTSSHKNCFGKIFKYMGTLDILIINEDKWEKNVWEKTSPELEKVLFQSNVFGVVSLSRLAVKYFNFKQKGKLAVTSSLAGLIGVPYSGSYTGTKHALHGYFNGLKIEKLGENISTILLCLGSSEISQEKISKKNKKETRKSESTKKMSAERYAHLCLTAIVNNLDEVWMAPFPILPLIYGMKYYPNVTKMVLKYLKPRGNN